MHQVSRSADPSSNRSASARRILFYAVNKVGLGHAVRLSILQKVIQRDGLASCHFFTDSDHVEGLFSCPGGGVRIPEGASSQERVVLIDQGFRRALERVRPDVVVCDTYWPQIPIARLRDWGTRTILILRLMNSTIMPARVRTALEAFDTVMVPHHPAEIAWTFRNHPAAIQYLSSQPIGCVGPIARRVDRSDRQPSVVFTVGGGGEWPGASHANRIPTYLETFYEAAGSLMDRGHPKPWLAVGPLLRLERGLSERFRLLRTKHLHRHFARGSIVVSRGGYNTSWEAIAASSRLVLCGSHRSEEDVDARCRFLAHEQLGRRVELSSRALVDAIERPWADSEQLASSRWSRLVNTGLRVVVDEVIGQQYLRACEA